MQRTKKCNFSPYSQPILQCTWSMWQHQQVQNRQCMEDASNAIAWIHEIAGVGSPSSNGAVRSIVEGYRRILAKPTKKKEPVTAQNLRDIIRNTDMSDLTSVKTAAVCLLSFAAFLRFDELTKLNCNDVKFYDGSIWP